MSCRIDDGRYESPTNDTLETLTDSAKTLTRTLTRMESLIDDLLVLAREGQEIDERESVSLSTLVEGCWEMVDQQAADLVVVDDRTIAADPDRLQQLFENLFRNAVEHGGSDITIRVGTLDNGFYVEDTGPGIPADKREMVFESGFTTNRNGTGFGLNIVSEIVTAHDWAIEVTESDEGGARFEITGVDDAVADDSKAEKERGGETGNSEE